jgi:hypothetical protein
MLRVTKPDNSRVKIGTTNKKFQKDGFWPE